MVFDISWYPVSFRYTDHRDGDVERRDTKVRLQDSKVRRRVVSCTLEGLVPSKQREKNP